MSKAQNIFQFLMRSRYRVIIALLLCTSAILYLFSLLQYSQNCLQPRHTCLELRSAGCSISGVYKIIPDPVLPPIEAYCDMKTDQGGWTLVANYLHQGSANPVDAVLAFKDRLPVPTGGSLGDEAKGKAWGHAGNSLLSRMAFHEVRFFCRSSSHSRLLDMVVSSPQCIQYFMTGKGTCAASPESRANLLKNWRALEGDTGNLPASAEKGWQDQGDNALLYYPFFVDWKNHWSTGAASNRWECDDYEAGGKNNTLHQVYVR